MENKYSDKWHLKIVRPTQNCLNMQIGVTDQCYLVTAMLYDYSNGKSIFAIYGETYSESNPCWITFEEKNEDLDAFLTLFEIIPDDMLSDAQKKRVNNTKQILTKENLQRIRNEKQT